MYSFAEKDAHPAFRTCPLNFASERAASTAMRQKGQAIPHTVSREETSFFHQPLLYIFALEHIHTKQIQADDQKQRIQSKLPKGSHIDNHELKNLTIGIDIKQCLKKQLLCPCE